MSTTINSVNVVASDQLLTRTTVLYTGQRNFLYSTILSTSKTSAGNVTLLGSSIVISTGVSSLPDRKPGTGKSSLTGGPGCR